MPKDDVRHPIFARFYLRMSPSMDRGGFAEHRVRLLAGLSGHVIEVGAGNGLNFAYYPPEVVRVLAVEPEPRLREAAHRAAERAPVPVEVVDGVAERLPAADASADAAVVSQVLCSVADLRTALREMHRVVRPGGELRFLEHAQAEDRRLRRVQRLVDATVWPTLFGGCHSGRDIVAEIERAAFAMERLDRFSFPSMRVPFPTSPHVLGTASRP